MLTDSKVTVKYIYENIEEKLWESADDGIWTELRLLARRAQETIGEAKAGNQEGGCCVEVGKVP